MLGEIVDPLRQDRDLYLGRPGVARLLGMTPDDFGFLLGRNRHRSNTLWSAGSAMQSGQVEHALGNDFSAVDLGKGNELTRRRDVQRAAEDGGVPSAHQDGLAPL